MRYYGIQGSVPLSRVVAALPSPDMTAARTHTTKRTGTLSIRSNSNIPAAVSTAPNGFMAGAFPCILRIIAWRAA